MSIYSIALNQVGGLKVMSYTELFKYFIFETAELLSDLTLVSGKIIFIFMPSCPF